MSSEERAERVLGQLHQWAMEAMEVPRVSRAAFIEDVAARYRDDAIRNGLSPAQADAWRESIVEWLGALVDVIETSGGSAGGTA